MWSPASWSLSSSERHDLKSHIGVYLSLKYNCERYSKEESAELCLSLVNQRPRDILGGGAVATEPQGVWFSREGPQKGGQMARSTDRAGVRQKASLLRLVRNNLTA